MKKFIVERTLPGAGNLTAAELKTITDTSCTVVRGLNQPYHWIQSFVTDDKIFCIHIAESEEIVREHAKRGNFPVNKISEVRSMIDPAYGG